MNSCRLFWLRTLGCLPNILMWLVLQNDHDKDRICHRTVFKPDLAMSWILLACVWRFPATKMLQLSRGTCDTCRTLKLKFQLRYFKSGSSCTNFRFQNSRLQQAQRGLFYGFNSVFNVLNLTRKLELSFNSSSFACTPNRLWAVLGRVVFLCDPGFSKFHPYSETITSGTFIWCRGYVMSCIVHVKPVIDSNCPFMTCSEALILCKLKFVLL